MMVWYYMKYLKELENNIEKQIQNLPLFSLPTQKYLVSLTDSETIIAVFSCQPSKQRKQNKECIYLLIDSSRESTLML